MVLQIYLPQEGNLTIHLLDNTGKTVKSFYQAASKGVSSVAISAPGRGLSPEECILLK